jgi:hypothetical protein
MKRKKIEKRQIIETNGKRDAIKEQTLDLWTAYVYRREM